MKARLCGAVLLVTSLGMVDGDGQAVALAFDDLLRSAEHGRAEAQNALGTKYLEGDGVPVDFSQAALWYRKSADQGNALGELNLGFRYWLGEGVPQDYKTATSWFRKAADQGDAQAQYVLAGAYLVGSGVPLDYIQAHMWVSLAVSNAPEEDRQRYLATRGEIAGKMTAKQITAAQRLAWEWRPKPAK